MRKHIFALLLAALMLLTACAAPAQSAKADPTEAPATEAPAPEPTAAPTAEPAPAEYELEREPGCVQLSLYWTKKDIDFDTSDMWIWFSATMAANLKFFFCVKVMPPSSL